MPKMTDALLGAIRALHDARDMVVPTGERSDNPVAWDEFEDAIEWLKKAKKIIRELGEADARHYAHAGHEVIEKLCAKHAHGPIAEPMARAFNLSADAAGIPS